MPALAASQSRRHRPPGRRYLLHAAVPYLYGIFSPAIVLLPCLSFWVLITFPSCTSYCRLPRCPAAHRRPWPARLRRHLTPRLGAPACRQEATAAPRTASPKPTPTSRQASASWVLGPRARAAARDAWAPVTAAACATWRAPLAMTPMPSAQPACASATACLPAAAILRAQPACWPQPAPPQRRPSRRRAHPQRVSAAPHLLTLQCL